MAGTIDMLLAASDVEGAVGLQLSKVNKAVGDGP